MLSMHNFNIFLFVLYFFKKCIWKIECDYDLNNVQCRTISLSRIENIIFQKIIFNGASIFSKIYALGIRLHPVIRQILFAPNSLSWQTQNFRWRDVIPLISERACRYISRMTRHPCLIRRTFLTCSSWVSYQWWSTAVNSAVGGYREEVAVAALSSFHFPDSMPYNVCRRLLI